MTEQRLTRRECLTRGAGAVIAAGVVAAGAVWLYDPEGDAGLPKPSKGGVRLGNYFADIKFPVANPRISVAVGGQRHIEQMVRAAVAGLDPAHGMKRFVGTGDVVLIKPNVGFDRPAYLGATTHPEVLAAVIGLCFEAGARDVLVTDNPIESAQACFAKTGIRRAAEGAGARVVLPAQSSFETLLVRDRQPDPARGEALGRWPILYRPLDGVTKLIGVAPIKDHNLASASMQLKNWYGLLGGRRNQFHQAIDNIISDLALVVSPTLVIADATRVMMRNGPTGGRLTDVEPGGKLGRPAVIASVDPVACDAWCYQHLLGRDPAKLGYLEPAHKKIQTQIADGWRRFGECDWRVYERQGKIVTASL